MPFEASWNNTYNLSPRSFICGHCGHRVGPNLGYMADQHHVIYICGFCMEPTYFDDTASRQVPGAPFGNPVVHVPEDVNRLYNEARDCMAVSAYTAAVLACRKVLMHVAVQEGAEPNLTFIKYVEYLRDQHCIPLKAAKWVDHIREKSNEANHEVVIMERPAAEQLLSFLEVLLKVLYEFPARAGPPSDL